MHMHYQSVATLLLDLNFDKCHCIEDELFLEGLM